MGDASARRTHRPDDGIDWKTVSEDTAIARAYATLVEGNRILLRSHSEADLLQEMCDLSAIAGGYAFAWYGIPVHDEAKSVRVAAVGGEDGGYARSITVHWGDDEFGNGPTGLAIRTRQTQVRNNLATDPRFAPWLESAALRAVHCSIALPVVVAGEVHGALMVYARDEGSFDERAQDLLENLAADLGYGIGRLRDVEALAESEAKFRLLAENSTDLIFSVGADGAITWVSPSITPLLGWEPAELVGHRSFDIVYEDDHPLIANVVRDLETGKHPTVRVRYRSKNGPPRWMEATAHPMGEPAEGRVARVIGARDIHERVLAEQALEHELSFDSLTGLASKRVSLERIQEILDTRNMPGWALFCVGVDGMTSINQAFTHAAGDEVLRAIAERLVEEAGAHDRVGRIAGDEFVVILRDVVTPTDAAKAAQRLLAAAHAHLQFRDARFDVSACVGVAMVTSKDAEALLRDATAAMRIAARKGPGQWGFLDENVEQSSRHSIEVQSAIRDAIADGEIVTWYMPVCDLAQHTVRGYEALARWVHPDGTVSTPDDFLPIVERSSIILDLDRTIIRQVLKVLPTLDPGLHIAVNVSGATLQTGTLAEWLIPALQEYEILPGTLHLEVTETALFNVGADVIRSMEELASAGVLWWIDDFGTGYSSISHLRDLPVNGLKLDRTFTDRIETDKRAKALARGVGALANGLDLLTIAEGVETERQAELLQDKGWRLGQGWLFGKAAPEPF